MKTEQEIRERIAIHQRVADEENVNGGWGGQDWCEAMTAIQELQWVLTGKVSDAMLDEALRLRFGGVAEGEPLHALKGE